MAVRDAARVVCPQLRDWGVGSAPLALQIAFTSHLPVFSVRPFPGSRSARASLSFETTNISSYNRCVRDFKTAILFTIRQDS